MSVHFSDGNEIVSRRCNFGRLPVAKIMADLLGKAIAGGIGGNVINSFTNGTNSNSVAELKSCCV